MTEVWSLIVAVLAFVLSGYVAWVQLRERRRANLTAYFHRTREYAQVRLADETIVKAGYHVVLWNQGPAVAHDIEAEFRDIHGRALTLLDSADGEFPLKRLDSAVRYPIPWVVTPRVEGMRRATAVLRWRDGSGSHSAEIPLRRGETSA